MHGHWQQIMSTVCTTLSEERVMCNGTIYKAEGKILSYCDKEFWIYIGVYAGLVLFAGKSVMM